MTREPKALTAKFEGLVLQGASKPIKGPFRIVLIRDGSLYSGFWCPTGQRLSGQMMTLQRAKERAAGLFQKKIEDWTECEPNKGLPV